MRKLMSNPIIVNELVREDIEIVRRVLIDSYQQYEAYFTPQGWKDYSERIVSSIDNPNVDKILVAKINQDILGSLQLFRSAEKAYEKPELQIQAPIIRLLGVHPSARGRGVAQALLKAVINDAQALGESNVYLHTTDFMASAIQIYEKLGFERDESKDFSRRNILSKCYRLDI
ncbi:GNAT family N-acetyltransferase [Oceanobacillus profundus]|uniref:GNAT family N-acetyltransferase n=1 Tax=Oceanobacillus TaxID=182709 RepID=UPI00203AB930|nr:GNAT family N-acetyltransferase [Oceanobacillus profundus]MCM3398331.1 GNAT family N-acetyltransferase [Oceanobacillus profundus]MDO6451857.1 GNAT family N-acetyltransferase [Oceanobacillus profundus]